MNCYDRLCISIGLSLVYMIKVGVILLWLFAMGDVVLVQFSGVFDPLLATISVSVLCGFVYWISYLFEGLVMNSTNSHEDEVLKQLKAENYFEGLLTPVPR